MIAARSIDASREQRAAFAYLAGNVFVGAGPGTGKTFLLVERYRYLRECGIAPAQILVLTFSRRAVVELRERLLLAGFAASEIDVRTFHGFAARVIGGGQATFRDGRLLDGYSRQVLLDAAIDQTPTPALGASIRASRAFRSELERMLDDLGRVPAPILAEIEADAAPRLRDILAIARWSSAARAAIGASDIGDLVGRAVSAARRPNSGAARWLAARYAHVLVDEFQDTDRLQLELLAILGANIFAVGDEAQSIYRFRGAGNDTIAAAIERFGMQRFDLTLSRRCPPDICALAAQTPIEGLRPLQSARTAGEPVDVVRLRAVDDEVAFLADSIETELDSGMPASEIAVLLRAFRPIGPLLIDELRRRSISVASTGREELLADPRIGTLRAALDVLDRPDDVKRWERLLTSRSLRFDPIAVRFAGDALGSLRLDASLATTLESVCSGGALGAEALAAALLDAGQAWTCGDLGSCARKLVRRLGLLAAVLEDETPSGVRIAAARLKLICDALAGAVRTAVKLGAPARCTDLFARFDEFLPALAIDDAGLDPEAKGVRVLTVHASKGLEFARVFVADAVAGRFPQAPRASTLFSQGDRALLARHHIDGSSIVPDAAALEEASLWYVALTRCKERLTISFADHALIGETQRPSRFIPTDRLPGFVTTVNRESLAMRGLHSGDAAMRNLVLASEALGDAPALADYARFGSGVFATGNGQPLRLDGGLSVGDAEVWLQCPRRLFYRKFAKLPDEESAALVLGSALHDVLQRFHARAAVFDIGSIDIDGWTRELLTIRAQCWDDERYASAVLAHAAAIAADVSLASYARALAERVRKQPFTVALREEKITVRAGQFTLAGRVDRVDTLSDGSRVVVDYKLGAARSTTVTKTAQKILDNWRAADAAELPRKPLAKRATSDLKLQLAFYATAFENVAEIAYVYLGGANQMDSRNGAVFALETFADDLREVVNATLREIEADLLAPLANNSLPHLPVTVIEENCQFCSYKRVCPGADDRNA